MENIPKGFSADGLKDAFYAARDFLSEVIHFKFSKRKTPDPDKSSPAAATKPPMSAEEVIAYFKEYELGGYFKVRDEQGKVLWEETDRQVTLESLRLRDLRSGQSSLHIGSGLSWLPIAEALMGLKVRAYDRGIDGYLWGAMQKQLAQHSVLEEIKARGGKFEYGFDDIRDLEFNTPFDHIVMIDMKPDVSIMYQIPGTERYVWPPPKEANIDEDRFIVERYLDEFEIFVHKIEKWLRPGGTLLFGVLDHYEPFVIHELRKTERFAGDPMYVLGYQFAIETTYLWHARPPAAQAPVQLNSVFDPMPMWRGVAVVFASAAAGALISPATGGWFALATTLLAWTMRRDWFTFQAAPALAMENIPKGFSADGLKDAVAAARDILSEIIHFKFSKRKTPDPDKVPFDASQTAVKVSNISPQLIYNAGLPPMDLARPLVAFSETPLVRGSEINSRLLRYLIQRAAAALEVETGLPIAAQAYGGLFYLADATGYVPLASLDDIDIQFSDFANGRMEERFIEILSAEVSQISRDVRVVVSKTGIGPTRFLLQHEASGYSVELGFHRLVTRTVDDLIEDLTKNASLSESSPGHRYMLAEGLIGDPGMFEQLRQRRLQNKPLIEETEMRSRAAHLSASLAEAFAHPDQYEILKSRLNERIRYLNSGSPGAPFPVSEKAPGTHKRGTRLLLSLLIVSIPLLTGFQGRSADLGWIFPAVELIGLIVFIFWAITDTKTTLRWFGPLLPHIACAVFFAWAIIGGYTHYWRAALGILFITSWISIKFFQIFTTHGRIRWNTLPNEWMIAGGVLLYASAFGGSHDLRGAEGFRWSWPLPRNLLDPLTMYPLLFAFSLALFEYGFISTLARLLRSGDHDDPDGSKPGEERDNPPNRHSGSRQEFRPVAA